MTYDNEPWPDDPDDEITCDSCGELWSWCTCKP